jgi:membrane protease YdiL (CAAX protease family)
MIPVRLAALALLSIAGLAAPALRPLWKLAATLLAITAANWLMTWADTQTWWGTLTGWISPAPVQTLFTVQFSKLAVALVILVVLAVLGFSRRAAYLTAGEINAPAGPEPWLGFPRAEPWGRFGTKWLVFLSLGMIVILSLLGRPNVEALLNGWRFIPMVLVIASLNAFSEELVYRSSLLASLVRPLGVRPAHWLTAVLFGISHYYGVPYGLGGVALATVMGWFLGKAMLETKGFLWPWLLHAAADVWIFYFILAGSVVPGG